MCRPHACARIASLVDACLVAASVWLTGNNHWCKVIVERLPCNPAARDSEEGILRLWFATSVMQGSQKIALPSAAKPQCQTGCLAKHVFGKRRCAACFLDCFLGKLFCLPLCNGCSQAAQGNNLLVGGCMFAVPRTPARRAQLQPGQKTCLRAIWIFWQFSLASGQLRLAKKRIKTNPEMHELKANLKICES